MLDLAIAKQNGVCPVCEGYGGGEDPEGHEFSECEGVCPECWCSGCHDGQEVPEERFEELEDGNPQGSWLAYELIHKPDQPTPIQLDFKTHWCPLHLEPFRDEWPKQSGIAMVLLAQASLEDPKIIEHYGADAESREERHKDLAGLLGEFAPLCCHIDPGELSRIYAQAGVDPELGLTRGPQVASW